jgi:hypothetical protein
MYIHNVSIFRAKVVILRTEWIYMGSGEGKDWAQKIKIIIIITVLPVISAEALFTSEIGIERQDSDSCVMAFCGY